MNIDLHLIDVSSSSFSSPHRVSSFDMLGGTAYDEMLRTCSLASVDQVSELRETHMFHGILDLQDNGAVSRSSQAQGQRKTTRRCANNDETYLERRLCHLESLKICG